MTCCPLPVSLFCSSTPCACATKVIQNDPDTDFFPVVPVAKAQRKGSVACRLLRVIFVSRRQAATERAAEKEAFTPVCPMHSERFRTVMQ